VIPWQHDIDEEAWHYAVSAYNVSRSSVFGSGGIARFLEVNPVDPADGW
jgi:hypothetical protein